MTTSQYETCAQGLSRAQEQLSELIPIEVQQVLAKRAIAIRPTLSRLRTLVELDIKMGSVSSAQARLAQIPRFSWVNNEPNTVWHDKMRDQLNVMGADLPLPVTPASQLVIGFAFLPFNTTSGNVLARRIEAGRCKVDLISNDMSGRASLDHSLYGVISPLIGQHLVLNSENWPARPDAIEDFADKAVKALASGRFGSPHYEDVYSRAMWVQSHFAAAALMAAGRVDRWTAEFSDPCRLDLDGKYTTVPVNDVWLESAGIAELLRQRSFYVPQGRSLMFWAEYLAFCLADKIIFTNTAQRDLMLSNPEDPPEVQARAASVAEIVAQPGPGQLIMSALPMPRPVRGPLWIGYFGSINSRRDLLNIFRALSRLPGDLHKNIHLHIYGTIRSEVQSKINALNIGALIQIRPSLDYLDALAKMREMDWLLISDTPNKDSFKRNPYLPSKLADYVSANRPIFALVEADSPLAESELPIGSIRADIANENDILDALIRIASSGKRRLNPDGAGLSRLLPDIGKVP